MDLDDSKLTILCTAGVRRELCDQFIAACNGKPPSPTKAFISKCCEIEYQDVASSGIFADELRDKCPWEWTKPALKTL
jgi:hypothetical protein